MAASIGALAASWLIANHYPPWVTSHSELLAACAAAFLALAALSSSKDRIAVPIAALYVFSAGWVVLWSAQLARPMSNAGCTISPPDSLPPAWRVPAS
ncbi:MAG: hypothetical protein ABIO71_08800 [Caldimonas sp.]